MSRKFDKIKLEAKKYIVLKKGKSNRKLMALLIEKYNNPVSYRLIGDFKNSKEFSQLSSQLSQKIPRKVPRKNNGENKKLKDIVDLMADFNRVVSCIHINPHSAHHETLIDIVGSAKAADVRKWLIKTLSEVLVR